MARGAQPVGTCPGCGRARYPSVGDVTLRVAGATRTLRHMPHVPACTCGVDGEFPLDVLIAVSEYAERHPEAMEIDATPLLGNWEGWARVPGF